MSPKTVKDLVISLGPPKALNLTGRTPTGKADTGDRGIEVGDTEEQKRD